MLLFDLQPIYFFCYEANFYLIYNFYHEKKTSIFIILYFEVCSSIMHSCSKYACFNI